MVRTINRITLSKAENFNYVKHYIVGKAQVAIGGPVLSAINYDIAFRSSHIDSVAKGLASVLTPIEYNRGLAGETKHHTGVDDFLSFFQRETVRRDRGRGSQRKQSRDRLSVATHISPLSSNVGNKACGVATPEMG